MAPMTGVLHFTEITFETGKLAWPMKCCDRVEAKVRKITRVLGEMNNPVQPLNSASFDRHSDLKYPFRGAVYGVFNSFLKCLCLFIFEIYIRLVLLQLAKNNNSIGSNNSITRGRSRSWATIDFPKWMLLTCKSIFPNFSLPNIRNRFSSYGRWKTFFGMLKIQTNYDLVLLWH